MTQLALVLLAPRRRRPTVPGFVLIRAADDVLPIDWWACEDCGAFEQVDAGFVHVDGCAFARRREA